MVETVNQQTKNISRLGAFEKRVHEVDFVRGLLMIVVILDHIFLKLWQLGLVNPSIPFLDGLYKVFSFYWYSDARSVIRPLVLFGFTFISGLSSAFSKNNWKRAGLLLVVYSSLLVITNVMQVFVNNGATVRIDFNVIGVLAFSTIFYCLFQKYSWKPIASFALLSVLITVYFVPFLTTIPGFTSNVYIPVLWSPEFLRSSWDPIRNCFVYGRVETMGIAQGDYMPLFPYIGFFFLGALVAKFLYKNKKSIFKNRYNFERPFCFVGRHAIWFYLGHQVILFPLFEILRIIFSKGV